MCKYTDLKLSYPKAEKFFTAQRDRAVNTLEFCQCCINVTNNRDIFINFLKPRGYCMYSRV
jgi:hypothetical protein